MIINDGVQKVGFLQKPVLDGDLNQESLDSVWKNISTMLLGLRDSSNSTNQLILESLDRSAQETGNIVNDLGILTSKLADIYVLSGRVDTSVNLFDLDEVDKSGGVIINRDTSSMTLSSQSTKKHHLMDVGVITNGGALGNRYEYDSIKYGDLSGLIGNSSRLEIEKIGGPLSTSILMDIGYRKLMNTISFNLENFGILYPVIDSLEVSPDGRIFSKVTILRTGNKELDINEMSPEVGVLDIKFSDIEARYVRLNMSQNMQYSTHDGMTRYAIGMNELSISLDESMSSGEIILGPYRSSSDILKVAIDLSLTGYDESKSPVEVFISSDAESWIPISRAMSFGADSEESKIINFNNIDTSSIKTGSPIRSIYVKVILEANSTTLETDTLKYIKETSRLSAANNTMVISQGGNDENTLIYKVLGRKLGGVNGVSRGELLSGYMVIDAKSEATSIGRSMLSGSTNGFSTESRLDTVENKLDITMSPDRLFTYGSDIITAEATYAFDPSGIEVFESSKPSLSTVRIESQLNVFRPSNMKPVIMFTSKSDMYTLECDGSSVNIDMRKGFFNSIAETIIEVSAEATSGTLRNSIGEIEATITPVMIDSVNTISIFNSVGCQSPEVGGLIMNTMFPFKKTEENEFTIENGIISFGNYYSGEARIHAVREESVGMFVKKDISRNNKIVLYRNKKIKNSYSLRHYDMKQRIKLNDVCISPGSVRFDYTEASVASFTREVVYIDGDTEFSIPTEKVQVIDGGLNKIHLSDGFLDDGAIEGLGTQTVYINKLMSRRVYSEEELVDDGDYMISSDLGLFYIQLPDGIETSHIERTVLTYNTLPTSVSRSGLYSINYKDGILYSSGVIDGGAIISYDYSYVFGRYIPMERLEDSRYTISNGRCTLLDLDSDSSDFVSITEPAPSKPYGINTSPMVTDAYMHVYKSGGSL